jgi:hypothetical protein
VTAVDLHDLRLADGGYLLVKRALRAAGPAGLVTVKGTASGLDVDLRAWCRLEGHRVEPLAVEPSNNAGTIIVRSGGAESDRLAYAERAGIPDDGGREVVDHPPLTWGLAPRGALVEAGGPAFDFNLADKADVWADDAGRIYEQAVAAQWDPATAIAWYAPFALDEDVESAVVQVMTYLIENETAALIIPSRFIAQMHPHFREVMQVLAVQAADEARHIEVFTRRARLKRDRLGLSTVGGQTSLKTLLDEPEFAVASFLLSVLGEGTFLSLLRFIEEHAPDPVTAAVARLAAQDEARHVAFGLAHLGQHLSREPDLRPRLADAIRRRHDVLRHTAGLNAEVYDALLLMAAGSWQHEDLREGSHRLFQLTREMDEGRRRRLMRLGFTCSDAISRRALNIDHQRRDRAENADPILENSARSQRAPRCALGGFIIPLDHRDAGRAGLDVADHGRAGEALRAKATEHLVHRFGRAGDEQSSARLRIGQDRLFDRAVRREVDLMAVSLPVPGRAARDVTGGRHFPRVAEQGDRTPPHARAHARSAANLEQVSQQAEARHVGESVHAGEACQLQAWSVELRRAGNQLPILRAADLLFLERRPVHTHTERLAENDLVSGPRSGVPLHEGRVDETDRHETVDRLDRIDAVSARDRNAGAAADRFAAVENLSNGVDGQLADRHRHESQGKERPAAHRVHVRDRVGRRDRPEVERIVHDRHEEVGRGDNRLALVDLVNGRIVAGFEADQQLARHETRPGALGDDLLEHRGSELAAASAAVRETGQPHRLFIGLGHDCRSVYVPVAPVHGARVGADSVRVHPTPVLHTVVFGSAAYSFAVTALTSV